LHERIALAQAFTGLLWVPLYKEKAPARFGCPFFYWVPVAPGADPWALENGQRTIASLQLKSALIGAVRASLAPAR
jgi:hypothetical protein